MHPCVFIVFDRTMTACYGATSTAVCTERVCARARERESVCVGGWGGRERETGVG
jgi:hypothetical protein